MARSDLLTVPCYWGIVPYRHFGIDIGDGTVVHLASVRGDLSRMEVQRVDIETFADGKAISIEQVSDPLEEDQVVERALAAVGNTHYHVALGNCEHFARLCKSGEHVSHQMDRLLRGVIRVGLASLASASARTVGNTATAGVAMSRTAGIATLVGEAARHGAYALSRSAKLEHRNAERIGRGVGAISAAVAGYITKGPAGCASAATLYFTVDAMSRNAMHQMQSNAKKTAE